MKKYFSTGLVILLPVILTLMIVGFLINFFTHPFLSTAQAYVSEFNLFTHPFLFFNESTLIILTSKGLILLGLIGCIFIVGFFGKIFLVDCFFRFADYFLYKLPYVSKIYKACQEIVRSLFSSKSKAFSQVVFIPFPCIHNLSIGLVTKDSVLIHSTEQGVEELVPVFIPGTPNPSVGFLLMFKRDQLVFVDMKVEEAMKFVVSCGVVMPCFKIVQPT